jgi:hypothetical protein
VPGGGAGTDAAPDDAGRCPNRWSMLLVSAGEGLETREARCYWGIMIARLLEE